jgi:hypothetical protein
MDHVATPVAPAGPLAPPQAWGGVARCVVRSLGMLRRREVRTPGEHVDAWLRFADGSRARVYRETVVDQEPAEPAFIAVAFRLRGVHGRGHAAFRVVSILNTPLFVGFPGFVSKLWLTADELGRYRGLYEWDGTERAQRYVRSLWRVLALVSVPGSIDYRVVPGVRRDDAVADPAVLGGEPSPLDWWRPVPH